jgi:hypothetical protein
MRSLVAHLPIIGKIEIILCNDRLAEFTIRQLTNYIIETRIIKKQRQKNQVSIITDKKQIIDKFEMFLSDDMTLARKIRIIEKQMIVNASVYTIMNNTLRITTIKKQNCIQKIYKQIRYTFYGFYHALFYELILFPVFSLYSLFDGYYLLHGSLITFNDKNALLMGLDGVGKSSTANGIALEGGKILSDNFILYNNKNDVVPLNLAIRLEPHQESGFYELYRDKNLKEVLSIDIVKESVKVDKFFILTVSKYYKVFSGKFDRGMMALFLNNAPEISLANNFITPFIYMDTIRSKENIISKDVDVFFLNIPKGQIIKGVEAIIHEC